MKKSIFVLSLLFGFPLVAQPVEPRKEQKKEDKKPEPGKPEPGQEKKEPGEPGKDEGKEAPSGEDAPDMADFRRRGEKFRLRFFLGAGFRIPSSRDSFGGRARLAIEQLDSRRRRNVAGGALNGRHRQDPGHSHTLGSGFYIP
jgi:hypothetical protein